MAVNHTERFREHVARRERERAERITVSWRKVSDLTGGGYNGLASNGQRVYAAPHDGGWLFGVMRGKRRCRVGVAETLAKAQRAAEALLRERRDG